MDRNSIIGLILIGILIIGYSVYNRPGPEEIRAAQQRVDSIAKIEKQKQAEALVPVKASTDTVAQLPDSVRQELEKQKLGDFALSASGTEQLLTLENNLIKAVISSKGGRIKSVELKKYKTWDKKPLLLMNSDSSDFNLSFSAQNRIINTSDLYFQSYGSTGTTKSIRLRLPVTDQKFVEYVYTLPEDSYMMNFNINMTGMEDVIASNASYINIDWKDVAMSNEKSIENERNATSIYYRFSDEDVDHLSEQKDAKENLKTKVQWIAFKQQFFSSVLIADNSLESPIIETITDNTSLNVVKKLSASFSLPYERKPAQSYGMRFYFGPNHYQTLKKIDNLQLEKLIPLGWGIFGWVNRFLVIPTFNFLNSFDLNYGLIILILTIIVRIVLLPLTYGSFKSQAKMKVLQPEVAELTEKYKDDALKKQQETMAIYKKAGVNPLGGCIPGLLQLPILIAMFRFFPSSIELRQQHFLWATDLSTYDSILDLSFHIPAYGNHVSLFTLLMTISTLIYTRMNMQMTAATNPSMKWMMYLMPILFLGFFNSYAAGLSYYYFLSNVIGFGQQYLFKAFIDEKKIHAQIQENKKKPVKKSGFQQRIEQMAKERGIQPPKRK